MKLCPIGENGLFRLRIHVGHRLSQHLIDPVLLIPAGIRHGDLIRLQPCHNGFGKHGAVVGGIGLVRHHHNAAGLIPLPDGLRRVETGCTVAQNQIKFLCIVDKSRILVLHGNKVFLAHAAHRADLQGRVEDFPADQTFHQSPAAALFGGQHRLFILYQAAKPESVLISSHQVRLAGFEPDAVAVRHLHAQLFQPLHNVGNALAAPSVASESSRVFSAVGPGKHVQGQLPDRPQSLPHNGGRSQENAVGKQQFLRHLCPVGLHQIVTSHVHISAVRDSPGDLLRQLFGVAVSAHVGNDHRLSGIGIFHRGPLSVELHHLTDPFSLQHRAVPRTDHGNVHGLHPVQSFQHKGLKRSDNAVIIIFQRFPIVFFRRNLPGNHLRQAVVGAEGIAGHQDLLFLNKRIHGIRPVQVGNDHKTQSLSSDFHGLVVFHRNRREIPVDNFL